MPRDAFVLKIQRELCHLKCAREIFGSEIVVVKLQSACYEMLNSSHVFNVRKTKGTAKFGGLEPRCC